MLLIAGCQSGDFDARGLSKSFKSDIDWVRDAFGQPVAKLANDNPQGPFPDLPNDQRPLPRSLKQNTDLTNVLKADHATADNIQTALAKSDPTQFLSLNGAKPTAQPIALTSQVVTLPDGVRDIDSYDPGRAASWFELGRVDFAEGSAELPDAADEGLRRVAQLLRKDEGALRVAGYSASDRLTLEGKGPHEANRWLADLRARRVAEKLIAFGAPPRRLLVGPAQEADRNEADKVEIILDH